MSTESSNMPSPGRPVDQNAAAHDQQFRSGPRPESGSRNRWKMPLAILVGAILSAVLAAINALQLQSLERALGGLKTPEAQFGGYDAGYIELVRSRMTDELLERYGASHYLWDMLFPLVFAATIILLIAYICAGRKRRWLLMLAPILFAVVDIAENLTLESLMIGAGSDPGIDASVVTLAAALTIGKVVLFGLSLAAALLALLTRPKAHRS